jgi:outer membrane lipoprotein SlyB
VPSNQGQANFQNLAFKQWSKTSSTSLGQFYIKAFAAGLSPTTCHGPIQVSDALRFATQPSSGDEQQSVSSGVAGSGVGGGTGRGVGLVGGALVGGIAGSLIQDKDRKD